MESKNVLIISVWIATLVICAGFFYYRELYAVMLFFFTALIFTTAAYIIGLSEKKKTE